jgi:hypothetical protein
MGDKTIWETFKAEGATVVERVKEMVHEGNVRRVVIEHEGRKLAEFPLTIGVVGTMAAPVLAAVGALVAVVKDCTIRVERQAPPSAASEPPAAPPEAPTNP